MRMNVYSKKVRISYLICRITTSKKISLTTLFSFLQVRQCRWHSTKTDKTVKNRTWLYKNRVRLSITLKNISNTSAIFKRKSKKMKWPSCKQWKTTTMEISLEYNSMGIVMKIMKWKTFNVLFNKKKMRFNRKFKGKLKKLIENTMVLMKKISTQN